MSGPHTRHWEEMILTHMEQYVTNTFYGSEHFHTYSKCGEFQQQNKISNYEKV